MTRRPWLVACLALSCLVFAACSQNPLKAGPADTTPFLRHAAAGMKPDSGETPFHQVYHARDPNLLRRASAAHFLYISPVEVRFLRPVRRGAGNTEAQAFNYERPVAETAEELRQDFIRAFRTSQKPRFLVTRRPVEDGLTLDLALTELNPTAPVVNFLRWPARLLSPLLPFGLGSAAKGSVALEGLLRDNQTGQVVFAFADREKDQISLFSVRDFGPYAHTSLSLDSWARQFEEYTRTPSRDEVDDSLPFRFNPF